MLWHLIAKLHGYPNKLSLTYVESVALQRYALEAQGVYKSYGYWLAYTLLELTEDALNRSKNRSTGITPKKPKRGKL
jgi:hypothetical protein